MAVYDLHNFASYFRSQQVTEMTLQRDEVLFDQGETPQSLFFIVKGEVRTESYLPHGKSVIYFRARAGVALTEEALFLKGGYLYTGIATKKTTVLIISKVDFLDEFKNSHAFCNVFL